MIAQAANATDAAANNQDAGKRAEACCEEIIPDCPLAALCAKDSPTIAFILRILARQSATASTQEYWYGVKPKRRAIKVRISKIGSTDTTLEGKFKTYEPASASASSMDYKMSSTGRDLR